MYLKFEDSNGVPNQVSDPTYSTDGFSPEGLIWASHKRYEKPAQTAEESRKLYGLAVFQYNTRSENAGTEGQYTEQDQVSKVYLCSPKAPGREALWNTFDYPEQKYKLDFLKVGIQPGGGGTHH